MISSRLSRFGHLFDSTHYLTDKPPTDGAAFDASLRLVRVLAWAMLAVGLLSRLSPLLDIEGRIFWQYMTEDGYLMQTVARNMARGLGMSTAEGTIPTNGVQPLATYIFAALHWLAGGDRTTSITLVMIVSAAVAAGGAYLLYRLAALLLAPLRHGETFALVIAAVWFSAAKTTAHSMNGLETGVYVAALLGAITYYLSTMQDEPQRPRWSQAGILGVLLGITFLARNDAVFFIAALLSAHLAVGLWTRSALATRLQESVFAGILSIVIGLPWMINNYNLFGTIVPISGLSQSNGVAFGQNLRHIPVNLLESTLPFVAVPSSIEGTRPVIMLACVIVAVLLFGFWLIWGRRTPASRRFSIVMFGFAGGLTLYYGLLFGAPHFLSRYMSSAGPMLWLGAAAALFCAAMAVFGNGQLFRTLVSGTVAALLVLACLMGIQRFRAPAEAQMHKQVVDWTAKNVEPQRWVGAVQTGTLGYFHDRTLNLDGKVNPTALRALIANGNVFDYVIDKTPIDFIVDWAGVGGWIDDPKAGRLREHFTLEVRDDQRNLSVLRRKQQHPLSQ